MRRNRTARRWIFATWRFSSPCGAIVYGAICNAQCKPFDSRPEMLSLW